MGVNKDAKKAELEANHHHHKKWVIAGIQIRAPLKPILVTKKQRFSGDVSDDEDDACCSTTPTSEDSMIQAKACPPPPPRKRKTAPGVRGCSYGGGSAGKEFFCPPDLETVFTRRHVA